MTIEVQFTQSKYFDPLRLNYEYGNEAFNKKIRRQKAEIKARHFKNVS